VGDTLIVGGFGGTLTFGPDTINGPDTSPEQCDPDGCADGAFAVLLDAMCEPQWAVALDGASAWNVVALAGDRFAITDSGNLGSPYSTNVITLDALGQTVWAKHFVAIPPPTGTGFVGLWMASDHAGNIFLVGTITGTVDFGGGPLSSDPQGELGVLVKLDANGTFVFDITFATDANSPIGLISTDDVGQVWLAGNLAPGLGSIDFGGTVFEASVDASADAWLGYIARLSASDGHYLGGVSFEGVQIESLVSDPCTGRTTVAGYTDLSADLGLGPIAPLSGFVLQLDEHETPIWNQAVLNAGWSSIAVDGAGNLIAAGWRSTPEAGIYASDVVVNGYDLAGNTRYAFSWPSTSTGSAGFSYGATPAAVTVGSAGSFGVVGGIGSYTTINFGLGLLPEEIDGGAPYGPSIDGFFVRFH
jgi:hypothetical protein